MTEKISIYKAGSQAIRKVILTSILWAVLTAIVGTIYMTYPALTKDFVWYWPALFGAFGIIIGLGIYSEDYSGLSTIGAAIGFLTGLIATTLFYTGPLVAHILLSLISATIGYLSVRFAHYWGFDC